MANIFCRPQTVFRFPTKSNAKFSLISCSAPGPEVSQVRGFKPSGLQDPGADHHLILSPARQEKEAEEVEEVSGDSKLHSQDNGQSVGLAETPRALRHV